MNANELTREIRDKRIAVAKDVLLQLGREELPLTVGRGDYLHGTGSPPEVDGSLQDHVDYLQERCSVCMLGAAFLSYTRLFNNVPSNIVGACEDGDDLFVLGREMRERMRDVFDRPTLDLMESVFEQCNSATCGPHLTTGHSRACNVAADFGDQFENSDEAARAIAQIIIDNDGEFILSDKPATP